MQNHTPPDANEVKLVIEERLNALKDAPGAQETVTIEWREAHRHLPVISMPVDLLKYNPGTHRIRAQLSLDPALERNLNDHPYGASAQGYLHKLLQGDPTDPAKTDPSFEALKYDLEHNGQSDPGIISREGVLINGNTRRAALKDLGIKDIRVGVLPPDAALDDIETIELALQLRKDHKRDYSFMNFLLALEERAQKGQKAAAIQSDFRIKPTTFDRSRWILGFVQEAMERSKVIGANNQEISLRLLDFESHQGKLEELYRAYNELKKRSPDEAEALKEQRLLALLLDKSKTDLRLIAPDFFAKFVKTPLPETLSQPPIVIPGTTIRVAGPSPHVQALKDMTTSVLQARAIKQSPSSQAPDVITKATDLVNKVAMDVDKALDNAGRNARVIKKRLAAVDRISDACDQFELAIAAVAEARATQNFKSEDLDEVLCTLRSHLSKLGALVIRSSDFQGDGLSWLNEVANLKSRSG